jgi:FAD/FMN-containing dehydrogenase
MIEQTTLAVITLDGGAELLGEASIMELAGALSGELIRPGDEEYDEARRLWNGMIDRRPALIARCRSTADVAACVNFARERGLLTAVRGGGHNAAGLASCDGGLVIDLSAMRAVAVDPTARVARAQGGATWADLDAATQAHGLATPGGAVSTTGIAGLTLSGGIGMLRRKHGLSCDNLVAVEIVTADGQVRAASEAEHPELFWAIRGGGGNFGVVTRLDYRLHPVGPEIFHLMVMYPQEQAATVVPAWRDFMATAPDELSCNGLFMSVPPAPIFPAAAHGRPVFAVAGIWSGAIAAGIEALALLRRLGEPLLDGSRVEPYVASQSGLDALFPAGALQYYWKSLYLNELSAEAVATLHAWSARRPSPMTLVDLWHMGGAAARVPADATAFGDRSAPYWLVINTTWANPADAEANITWARGLWEAMRPFSNGAVYLNFPGLQEEGEGMVRASHGRNYERLAAIKARYDGGNLFRLNQNIKPAQ